MGAYIPTIDPEIFGDAFVWKRQERQAQYIRAPYSLLADEQFQRSPLHESRRTKVSFRRRLIGPEAVSIIREVTYGNVGASGRLDFTAPGPVVNLASRL